MQWARQRIRRKYALGRTNNGAVSGFTIIELLIVIVIIAILAAITIVAYNGITQKAIDTRVISDMAQDAKLVEMQHEITGTWPAYQNWFAGMGSNLEMVVSNRADYASISSTTSSPIVACLFNGPSNVRAIVLLAVTSTGKTYGASTDGMRVVDVTDAAGSAPNCSVATGIALGLPATDTERGAWNVWYGNVAHS